MGFTENQLVKIADTDGDEVNIATEATLLKLVGFGITEYDYIALTYVSGGNGDGEIETAVFKSGGSGGTTLATLTLGYDASNRLNSVTKS